MNNSNSFLRMVGGVIFLGVVLYVLYLFLSSIFTVLSWIAPILLILTAIIDYKVIINYGKMVLNRLQDNLPIGILLVLLTIIGFPVVSGLLFFRALLGRQLINVSGGTMANEVYRQMQKESTEYADYEDLEGDVEGLELPERQIESIKKSK